jgi:hypothetical protein
MLLLSDQGSEVRERDREAAEVGKEVEEGRKGVAKAVSGLMARQSQEGEGEGRMDVDSRDIENSTYNNHGNGGQARERDEEDEDEDEDEGFEQVA